MHLINPTDNWREQVPVFAEDNYHVDVQKMGYLHQSYVVLTLIPSYAEEDPLGWNTQVKA